MITEQQYRRLMTTYQRTGGGDAALKAGMHREAPPNIGVMATSPSGSDSDAL
jgi:hypothetical protein